ncbi:hypothetical protein KPH14_008623 [Odynerus spinipes]|uniref:Uncharacterized protein n=1 Tax=Odynerus spinipes TaxID=1348599 RepID=A0AAD9RSE9_9HYME|nr:hypothetical protein KPH14_008623 [Odynerus spinipes]
MKRKSEKEEETKKESEEEEEMKKESEEEQERDDDGVDKQDAMFRVRESLKCHVVEPLGSFARKHHMVQFGGIVAVVVAAVAPRRSCVPYQLNGWVALKRCRPVQLRG